MPPPINSEDVESDIATAKLVQEIKKYAPSLGAVLRCVSMLAQSESETAPEGEESNRLREKNDVDSAQVTTGNSIDDRLYNFLNEIASTHALRKSLIQKVEKYFSEVEPTYFLRLSPDELKRETERQKLDQHKLRMQRIIAKNFLNKAS